MKQENVGPHELNGVTIEYIDVAPAFATSNAVVFVKGQGYLFTGDGAQNMICSLIMAHAMKYPVNFTANGVQDEHSYGYITKVTIGDAVIALPETIMKNDGVKEGDTTVAQFTGTIVYLPAPATLRSGFAMIRGTSSQTETIGAHFTDDKQPQCNAMFALTAAAFNSSTADLYLAAPFDPTDRVCEVIGVQIPGELSGERSSAPSLPPPSLPTRRSKIAPEGRADQPWLVYVQQIIVSPPSAPNNVLVTFTGVSRPYMLSGEVTALMQLLLFAKMNGSVVDAFDTGYVVDGHGYIDEVIINA